MMTTGAKIYPRRSSLYFFLVMYGILALAGGIMAALAVKGGQNPSNASGFMIVFGAGMFVVTALKGRKPQILVHEDFLELRQSRTPLLLRYRNMVTATQPDKMRLIVRLWEDGTRKEVPIWLKDIDPGDAARLLEFLASKSRKSQDK